MKYGYIKPKHTKYSRKGVLTLTHIFPSVPATAEKYIKRKKGVKGELQSIYHMHDNSQLVRMIFTTFLRKVLCRVVDGDLFMFPGKTKTHIVVKSIEDGDIKRLRKSGWRPKYNIVKAKFKIPIVKIDFGPFSRREDAVIHVPSPWFEQALKNAENDKYSWITIPKTLDRDVRDERYND